MIRRHKTTIFTDAKESSTVFELKRIVEGILKRPPDEQRLYKVRRAGGRVRCVREARAATARALGSRRGAPHLEPRTHSLLVPAALVCCW